MANMKITIGEIKEVVRKKLGKDYSNNPDLCERVIHLTLQIFWEQKKEKDKHVSEVEKLWLNN